MHPAKPRSRGQRPQRTHAAPSSSRPLPRAQLNTPPPQAPPLPSTQPHMPPMVPSIPDTRHPHEPAGLVSMEVPAPRPPPSSAARRTAPPHHSPQSPRQPHYHPPHPGYQPLYPANNTPSPPAQLPAASASPTFPGQKKMPPSVPAPQNGEHDAYRPPPVHFEQPAPSMNSSSPTARTQKRKAHATPGLPPKPPPSARTSSLANQRSNFRPAPSGPPRAPPSPAGSTASMPVGPLPFQRTKAFWETTHEPASDTLSEAGSRITRRRRIPLHVRTTHPDGKSFSLEQVAAQIEAWRAEIARPAKRAPSFSREDVTQQISKWRNASRAHSTTS